MLSRKRRMNTDIQNVKLLGIFHYVLGGLTALFSCFPFVHVFMGIAILNGLFDSASSSPSGPPPAFLGWIFILAGSVFIFIGWGFAALMLIAGRNMRRVRHRIYCVVVAGVECMIMPLGTILGVFTIVLLMKDSIKDAFDGPQPPPHS